MRRWAARRGTPLRLGVPAYEYPGGTLWSAMAALPPGALVVVDPADGPGAAADPTYVTAVDRLRRHGVDVLGYVTTGYGRHSADQMIGQATSYQRWYGLTGIFLDQTPSSSSSNRAIVATAEHLRAEQMQVAINPGQPAIDPGDAHMADLVVTFEGSLASYRRARFPRWMSEFPAERFWHLVYDVGDVASMRDVLRGAARQRAGVVLVTDAGMPNPWGRLPAYWDDELAVVSRTFTAR